MSPEYDHLLGPTASLVDHAIQTGKKREADLRLNIAALKGERDRLVGRNRELIKELDICRRAHRGDV